MKLSCFYRELTWNSQICEKQNRENTRQRKKRSHVQDSIYVVRQFAYVHGVTGISLLLGCHSDQTQLGSTKPNKSPIWRLVQSPTSTVILQKQSLIVAPNPILGFVTMTSMLISSLNLILIRTNLTFNKTFAKAFLFLLVCELVDSRERLKRAS